MNSQELAEKALALAAESTAKLERWLALFESRLAEAEQSDTPCDLKDFVAYTTALERSLKIAKLAQLLAPETADDRAETLDPDALRKLLSEED